MDRITEDMSIAESTATIVEAIDRLSNEIAKLRPQGNNVASDVDEKAVAHVALQHALVSLVEALSTKSGIWLHQPPDAQDH